MGVIAYTQSLLLKIKPWGEDSPLPNLFNEGFLNTYPYNYKDSFSSQVQEREFESMVLENEYLKVTVIPALGARLFSLYDKIVGREVFNVTEGIYPSPIFLRGVFFPIGIEFNFPQGHSVHAADPIPCEFVSTGVGESIVMHVFNAVTRIMTDITISLNPAERRVGIDLCFINTLPARNGFMYWGNAAVEQTPELKFQCKAPMCHFFDGYNTFPYVNGSDYRVAKNRLFASDLFAISSKEEWFGFYSPEKQHGCVHISPLSEMTGKKFFSWGFDEYAFRWGRHYGCSSYGYVEIQSGILDTQFEHLNLEPFEQRTVHEIWFPYSSMGDVLHATADFVFSAGEDGLLLTSARCYEDLTIGVSSGADEVVWLLGSITPGNVANIPVPFGFDFDDCRLTVTAADGKTILEKDIRPQQAATRDEIAAKQQWLDLKPTDSSNKLEIAKRLYKARRFSAARALLNQVTDSSLADEVSRIRSEIAYLIDGQRSLGTMGCQTNIAHVTSADRSTPFTPLEVTAETDALYSEGRINDAISLLQRQPNLTVSHCYILAYLAHMSENRSLSRQSLESVPHFPLERVNPFCRLEQDALLFAITANPDDARAHYLLGNYWSRTDVAKAREAWQTAVSIDASLHIAWRNLAYITMRDRERPVEAVKLYEAALNNGRVCPELVVEYVCALRMNQQVHKALEYIESLPEHIRSDYRTIKTLILLLRDNYRFDEALMAIKSADGLFIWEGEHDLHRCYLECLMALGNKAIYNGDYDKAIGYFAQMLEHPEQLVQGKSYDENQSAAYYYLGLAYESAGSEDLAIRSFEQALDQPFPNIHHAVSYRENEYYAALAARKLGDTIAFRNVVDRLLECDIMSRESVRVDLTPLGNLCWKHLAAARGHFLNDDVIETELALDRLQQSYGQCWPLDEARKVLAGALREDVVQV